MCFVLGCAWKHYLFIMRSYHMSFLCGEINSLKRRGRRNRLHSNIMWIVRRKNSFVKRSPRNIVWIFKQWKYRIWISGRRGGKGGWNLKRRNLRWGGEGIIDQLKAWGKWGWKRGELIFKLWKRTIYQKDHNWKRFWFHYENWNPRNNRGKYWN